MTSIGRRLLLGLAVALLVLLALEGLARLVLPAPVADPRATPPQEDEMLSSALLGWSPRPGESRAFGVPGRTWINAQRTRNPEFSPPQAREVRFLTLGDSTVYGVLVNDREVFSSVAAERLQRQLQRPVTAINGGVPGYSSEQARRLLAHNLRDVEFDVLVIATLWSDSQFGEVTDAWRFPARGARLVALLNSSGLYRLLDYALVGPRTPEQVEWRLHNDPDAQRVPLGRYTHNLHALAAAARDRGAEPLFLLLPSGRDLRGEPLEAPRPAYREAMRAVAADEEALLVDGAAPFRGGAASLMMDDVHPSNSGHRLLGETLADALAPLLQARP